MASRVVPTANGEPPEDYNPFMVTNPTQDQNQRYSLKVEAALCSISSFAIGLILKGAAVGSYFLAQEIKVDNGLGLAMVSVMGTASVCVDIFAALVCCNHFCNREEED